MKRLFLLGGSGALFGLSISCLVTMLIMATMLEKWSKDVNEVITCWFYMALFATISGLSSMIGIGAFLYWRGWFDEHLQSKSIRSIPNGFTPR